MTDQQYEASWRAIAWTAQVVAWLQPHQSVKAIEFDAWGNVCGFEFQEHIRTVGYRWSGTYREYPDQPGAHAACLLRWPELFPIDSLMGRR